MLASKPAFTTEDLLATGDAEDYLRVASNPSALLELGLSLEKDLSSIESVLTFASESMPLVAVAMVAGGDHSVSVYCGDHTHPFSEDQLKTLALLSCNIVQHAGAAPAKRSEEDSVVVAYMGHSSLPEGPLAQNVDAVVAGNTLFICDQTRVPESQVLIRRKRLSTPVTTPVALTMLEQLGGVTDAKFPAGPTADEEKAFLQHLQTLSGTAEDATREPVVFTAGLPTLASLWTGLVSSGGADIVMASTAYGGSSQLVDLLAGKHLRKHTFDLQGERGMESSVRSTLEGLAKAADGLKPTTVVFVEVPSNPDMKVPSLTELADMLQWYQKTTARKVILLVDATFAPNSQVLGKMQALLPELNAVVFLSMSKSVSRGMTTAGTLIFNHTSEGLELRNSVFTASTLLDTRAKPDQMRSLCENHRGVEERNAKSYIVARDVGAALQASVKRVTGSQMELHFVSPDTASQGFTTPTFSFNLPSTKDDARNAALAQKFVDLIAVHDFVKPCVSFGQDNGLLYATVPATSTQGAIKAEDKGKQAVGGVQLTRLSFSPEMDVSQINAAFSQAVDTLYQE